MKFIKTYLLEAIGAIILLFVMLICVNGTTQPTFSSNVVSYGEAWDIEIDGVTTHYQDLPTKIDNPNMSPIILKKKMPSVITEGKNVGFFTCHQNVTVYINDTEIYSFRVTSGTHSKTPGNAWNFVKIKKVYAEKELRIVLEPSYKATSDVIPEMYYGDKDALLYDIIKNAIVPLILCSFTFVMGVSVLLAAIFLRKQLHIPKESVWLGLFAIFLALWSGLETQMFPIFLGNHLLFNQLTFVSLHLIFVPIMMFVRYTYNLEDNRVMNFFCVASMSLFFVCSILQALGVKDYRESLAISHVLMISGALWVLYLTVRAMREVDDARKKVIKYNVVGVGIVAICALMDSARFYGNSKDAAYFIRFGFLIYIVMLIVMLLNNSIQLMRMGEEAEAIKEVAYLDALTKLGNRNAYEAYLGKLEQARWKITSVAMFDLNNLKYFNDVHGHSMGDYYIIICSEVLQDIFGRKGIVFRTGGDEFCAVMQNVTDEEFEEMKSEMEARITSLSGTFFEGKMSMASGFARYEAELDENFNNTITRADECMYACKQEMKKNTKLVVPIKRTPENV